MITLLLWSRRGMTAPEIWLYMLFSYIIYQHVTLTAHKVRSILFKTFLFIPCENTHEQISVENCKHWFEKLCEHKA